MEESKLGEVIGFVKIRYPKESDEIVHEAVVYGNPLRYSDNREIFTERVDHYFKLRDNGK
jgi:hypothetical protein